MEASSRTPSRCLMLMYFLLPHWVRPHGGGRRRPASEQSYIPEAIHHTGTTADLPIQPLNDIVSTDTGPVFTGEIATSQHFLNAILHLLGGLFQFHRAQFLHHSLGSIYTKVLPPWDPASCAGKRLWTPW